MKRVLELDPRDLDSVLGIANFLLENRQYSEAEHYCNVAITLFPNASGPYIVKAENYWIWKGSTQESRATLEKIPKNDESVALWHRFRQSIYERNYQSALELLSFGSDEPFIAQVEFIPIPLLKGFVNRLLNEPQKAEASFEAARQQLEKSLKALPDDPRIHSSLGIAYAGLGRKTEAVRQGKVATEMYPVSRDAVVAPFYIEDLALIYLMVGDQEAAIDQIEHLLSIPSWFSVPLLKLDPLWDPLRSHPRYQEIISKFAVI